MAINEKPVQHRVGFWYPYAPEQSREEKREAEEPRPVDDDELARRLLSWQE